MDDRHAEKFAVYWGTEQTPEAMTNKIVEYAPITTAPYIESISIIDFPEDGPIYIGFYAFSEADQNWIIVDDLTLEEIDPSQSNLSVYGLTYPGVFMPEKCYDRAQFTVYNNSVHADTALLTISIDGNIVINQPTEFQAQEKRNLSLDIPLSSLTDGEHTMVISVTNDTDPDLSDNELTLTFRKLGTPDIGWDFEDASVPESFTFRNEGWLALHPDAIEEWGEDGFDVFEIYTHELFGDYVFVGSTYLEEDGYSADIWCVLPQVTVTSSDACMSWMAMPLGDFTEAYRLYVSPGEDGWWDYEKQYQNASLTEPELVGVDLSAYEGQDIFIAFNLNSKGGDAIAFDNINLYGVKDTSGLRDIQISKGALTIAGNTLLCPADATVAIFDAAGRQVLTAKGTANLSALTPGLYIARATSASGTYTLKFIR